MADDIEWPEASGNAKVAVIYHDTGEQIRNLEKEVERLSTEVSDAYYAGYNAGTYEYWEGPRYSADSCYEEWRKSTVSGRQNDS